MLTIRTSRLLRATATVLLLCLGFLAVESLVADTCDGDAGAPGVGAWVAVGGSGAVAPASETSPGSLPAPSGHSTHVDHCVHPHGGGLVMPTTPPDAPRLAPPERLVAVVLAPPSRALEPLVRPPIA